MKPENICIGSEASNKIVYLIDFGLSKSYLDTKGNHIEIKQKTVGLLN